MQLWYAINLTQSFVHEEQFRCLLYQPPSFTSNLGLALNAATVSVLNGLQAQHPSSPKESSLPIVIQIHEENRASIDPAPLPINDIRQDLSPEESMLTKDQPEHRILVGTEHNTIMSFTLDSKVCL